MRGDTLLGGCRRALPPAAQESPTLLGTWRATANVPAGSLVFTLTFTKSRWIQHVRLTPDDGTPDRRVADWTESGTWEVVAGTVTREWAEYDEQGRRVTRSVAKTYYWGDDAGGVLFVHSWDLLKPGDVYQRYTRVRDPLPSPPSGVWRGSVSVDDGQGGIWDLEYTITINADGLFLSVEQRTGEWKRELIARWTDDEEEYFLYLTEPAAFQEFAGQEREPLFPQIINENITARIAYAPTDRSPAEIVVSPIWNEAGWPAQFRADPEDDDGDYWLTLERQP